MGSPLANATLPDRFRAASTRIAERYGRPDEPLAGYLKIMAAYALSTGAFALVTARTRGLPERVGFSDAAMLAAATHKLSRTLAKDAVASPFRAPFTEFEGPAGPGEVNEKVRGSGLRKAAGELVTCPFCLDQWVATGFVAGLAVAPRLTRFVASTFAIRAAADLLQFGYVKAQKAVEG